MSFKDEQRIRKEQMDLGRRAPVGVEDTPRVKFKPKGHDAILSAFQEGRRTVRVMKISGEVRTGMLVGRDKFTITILEQGIRYVIYKHAIEEFSSKELEAA